MTDPQLNDGTTQSAYLARDAIRTAKSHIYIEAQYLASFRIADALAARLREENGPEIVIVVTRISHGLIEKWVMGKNRNRIIRKLKRQDIHDRLWVMYAVVPDEEKGEQEVLIHSKLLIVDDALVRVGSSNLNNRSEGLDTEADISLAARNEADARAIAGLRNRLMAEHLSSTPERIADTFAQTGSLLETIRVNNKSPRGLRHFDVNISNGSTSPIAGTAIFDPAEPLTSSRRLEAALRFASMRGLRLLRLLGWNRQLAGRKK